MYAAMFNFYESQLASMQWVQPPLFKPRQGTPCNSTANEDIESIKSNDVSTGTTINSEDTSSIDSAGGNHGAHETYEAKMSA